MFHVIYVCWLYIWKNYRNESKYQANRDWMVPYFLQWDAIAMQCNVWKSSYSRLLIPTNNFRNCSFSAFRESMWKQMVQIQVPSPNHLWVSQGVPSPHSQFESLYLTSMNYNYLWKSSFLLSLWQKNNKSSGLDDAMNILHSVKTIID